MKTFLLTTKGSPKYYLESLGLFTSRIAAMEVLSKGTVSKFNKFWPT